MPKIKVELPDGPLIITPGTPANAEPSTYHVKDGHVTVAADKLDAFLAAVPGDVITDDAARAASKQDS